MLMYYNETDCVCKDEEVSSLQFPSEPGQTVIFGNKFKVPSNTKRIILRERCNHIIERVFLKIDKLIYPIRTRIFYPENVVVLSLKTGITNFTNLTEGKRVLTFARDESLARAIVNSGDLDNLDWYDLVYGNSDYNNIDNLGSSIRISFSDIADEYYTMCDDYSDTMSEYIQTVKGTFPMYSIDSLYEDICRDNDYVNNFVFNDAVNHCSRQLEMGGPSADNFIIAWNSPVLPERRTIDGYTKHCADNVLTDRSLLQYSGMKVTPFKMRPMRTVTNYDGLLLCWVKKLLMLPIIQIGIRYILPKMDYEILYHDAVNQKLYNDLIDDVAITGSDVVPHLLCPHNVTDIIVEKTKDDMLIIRSIGDNADTIVIDLILASALDDGFVTS